jgi:transaldolase
MMEEMSTHIHASGADLGSILELAHGPDTAGFTTDPTIVYRAGLIRSGAHIHAVAFGPTETLPR